MPVKTAADLNSAVVSDVVNKDYTTGEDVGSILEDIVDSAVSPPVTIKTLSIPQIAVDGREVASVNLGDIGDPSNILASFLEIGADNQKIRDNVPVLSEHLGTDSDFSSVGYSLGAIQPPSSVPVSVGSSVYNGKHPTNENYVVPPFEAANSLVAYKDYRDSSRIQPSQGETYFDGSGESKRSNNQLGHVVYSELDNVLFGWYGLSPETCPFNLSEKVQLQGAWIQYSSPDTILNIALQNRGANQTPSKDVKVAVPH